MENTNVVINYRQIIQAINSEISDTISLYSSDPTYKDILGKFSNIYVCDEQAFKKRIDNDPNSVYFIVKFGNGPINFGASSSPITIHCYGAENRLENVQTLCGLFCSLWTTKSLKNVSGASQIWTTPYVISSFGDVNTGFRNLLSISGTIILGEAAIRVSAIEYYKVVNNVRTLVDTIPVMTFTDNYQNSTSPTPFYDTKGFAKSEVKFSTVAFSFSTYLLNSQFICDILHAKGLTWGGVGTVGYNSDVESNSNFDIVLRYSNGYTNATSEEFFRMYKCTGASIRQDLGVIPSITISFSL